MSILVVGATGVVGGATIRRLREQNQEVSALVRGGGAHPHAGPLEALGVTLVEGDLTDPDSCARACRDADVVISTATSMPTGANDGLRRVDREGTLALIDAAVAARVDRFVYVSYSGNIREDSPLQRAKRDCERRLMAATAMETVILRPSYFMEVWLSPALGFDPRAGSARVYGTGDEKVSYVSSANVGDFAAAAATHHYPGRHTILEIGGPEALSLREVVRIFERAFGKTIDVQPVPLDAVEQQRQSDDPLRQTFGALTVAYANGDEIRDAAAVAEQHGITLRSVGDYAAALARSA